MTISIMLPRSDGTHLPYTPGAPRSFPPASSRPRSRVVYAAAHVVGNPFVDASVAAPLQLDWEATLAYRRYLWSFGLSVAEAMDTAQRGMGLDWRAAQELIRRSVAEARAYGGAGIACGAGTDQLAPSPSLTLTDVEEAYEEQCSFIEGEGGQIILMASRALAACAKTPDDYVRVYSKILSQAARPVILHWLGEMFDPALTGYWGYRDTDAAMEVCLQIIERHSAKIDGIKISLLDSEREIIMRRRLPEGVRMYTGDDFNYPELIRGDERGYSHALLGIFDAIAPAAAAALQALDDGDLDRYEAILAPTVPLSRHIFQTPTYSYKTGIVFLAYLNGHQPHFRMLAGLESARSIVHLAELFILADQAGLLLDPELATERMRRVLAVAGFDQPVGQEVLKFRPAEHAVLAATAALPVGSADSTQAFTDLARLSLNQITTQRWGVREAVEGCVRAGIPAIGLWRDKVAEIGVHESRRIVGDAGLRVSSLCRSGWFPAATREERASRLADNRRAIEEAAELGAELLVVVCGPAPDRDIEAARNMVEEAISQLVPYAAQYHVKLGIEPLHPMFAGDRSVIVTLAEANRLAARFEPDHVGVIIDVYHVWWDPEIYTHIARSAGRILGFHVSDWLVPLPDVLMGRGMMGDGIIELRRLRHAVESAGYTGPIEVEIFNRDIWDRPGDEVLHLMCERFLSHV